MKAKVTVEIKPMPPHESIFTPGNLVSANEGKLVVMVVTKLVGALPMHPNYFRGCVLINGEPDNANLGKYTSEFKKSDFTQFRGKVTLDTTGE